MAEKNPWFKLYAKDLLADENLKSCSMAARGMFIYMLSLMHRSGHRGHLCQINNIGKPMDLSQLSLLAGCETTEAERLVSELISAGVFAVSSDRIIYSRRMVREERISKVRSEAGSKGGKEATKGRAVLLEQNGKQNPSKGLSKTSSKPLGMGITKQHSISSEEEKEIDLNSPLGMGVQGEGVLLKQNPSKTENPDLSPAWLAERWVFTKAGHKGRDTVHAVRTTFEDMIRHGCPPAEIAADIDAPSRRLTEPVWDFEQRIMERLGLAPGRGKKQKTKAEEHAEILEKVKAAKTGGLP